MPRFARFLAAFAALILLCTSCPSCSAKVRRYGVKVVAEYPHDAQAYTQGLFWHDGKLYESTGLNGKSSLRIVDLKSGKPLKKIGFDKAYFGEGSVILGDKLYMLTWENKVLFVYDANTLEYLKTYSYPREGWGLTTDGKSLIASDGSNRIYFLDPDLKLQKTLNVTIDGRPLKFLNELEWIDGRIWANVYTTNSIVIINPRSGEVEGLIDCTGLLPDRLRTPGTDVLNGIAINPADGKIYLTGKNWKRLYEVTLVER